MNVLKDLLGQKLEELRKSPRQSLTGSTAVLVGNRRAAEDLRDYHSRASCSPGVHRTLQTCEYRQQYINRSRKNAVSSFLWCIESRNKIIYLCLKKKTM